MILEKHLFHTIQKLKVVETYHFGTKLRPFFMWRVKYPGVVTEQSVLAISGVISVIQQIPMFVALFLSFFLLVPLIYFFSW